MRLSRLGYGDILTIKNLDVATFFNLMWYEEYIDKYSKIFRDINKKG